MSERKPIPNYVRFQVFKRDKFTCQYCGASGCDLEIDHIEPVANGGSDDMDNLITACKACNRGKRDMPVLPEGYILRRENKSRRMQLLVRPYTCEGIKKLAEQNNQSMNDYVNDILEREIYQNGTE